MHLSGLWGIIRATHAQDIFGRLTPQEFQFGEFTLDESRYRLQRGAHSLRLEKLPMDLLILLVQRHGELVSREEIAGRLWGKDVFVDVDHSINTAVRKIRVVLRDDPEKPRFVETVVGKGYRFAAPVTCRNGGAPVVGESSTAAVEVPALATEVRAGAPEVLPEALGVVRVSDHSAPPGSSTAQSTGLSTGLSTALSTEEKTASIRLWALLAGLALVLIAGGLWVRRTDYFWRNPIAEAKFQAVTDFDGGEQAAAVSRDGHFVAFLSDRDGTMDVWVTQVGSGQFHNLTRGSVPGLANPAIRTLGFSPDGALVTYWARGLDASGGVGTSGNISVWGVPTLGGQPRPYLEGVAEYDWSQDGSRLVYHTPGPGDPMFVSGGSVRSGEKPIFTAPAGLHAHFPLWSPDTSFVYFVQGSLPDKLDIWRIPSGGGVTERITSHNAQVSYPVLLGGRTLMYLASDPDGSGPWLYGMDVERRIPHRLTSGPDRYTSLAANADGRRLVATLATAKRTLWRLRIGDRIGDSPTDMSAAAAIPLTTSTGSSPRLGPDYLLYVSATGTSESIWKLANGTTTELWSGEGARVFGGPAISSDGRQIAFSVQQHGKTLLYVMQADGTNARVVADSLELQGAPAWAPDGLSITSAVVDQGVPRLFRLPVDGHAAASFVREYSVDPVWARDGSFVVYSGPDIGTTFSVKAVTAAGTARSLPALTLTLGSRRMAWLPGGRGLVLLRGDVQHKNLWLVDVDTGAERQLTNLPAGFDIRDFDISPDGREVVVERVQERSDVVLLDLPRR